MPGHSPAYVVAPGGQVIVGTVQQALTALKPSVGPCAMYPDWNGSRGALCERPAAGACAPARTGSAAGGLGLSGRAGHGVLPAATVGGYFMMMMNWRIASIP